MNSFIPAFVAIVLMVLFTLFLVTSITDIIKSTEEKLDNPFYCDQVYENPDDFLPQEGTMEEKLQRCDDFMNGNGQTILDSFNMMLIFLLLFPILGVGYMIMSLYVMSNRGPNPDRTEYDPDFKGYGK